MESAQVRKAEATAKSTHAAPNIALKSEQKADSGAVTGMPLFLQRSVTDTTFPIQRQTDDLEEISEETLAEEDTVQAKLVVNEPGDIYEQEADRVAEIASSSFTEEAPVNELNPNQQIQRQANTPAVAAPSGLATADAGQPLSTNVRQQIEPVLGADLTGVRVHSQPSDRALAASLQAKAFTHDRHIWLGENQTADDVSLMAHETTHVVQQTANSNSIQRIQRKLANSQHPEDVAEPRRRMEKRIEDAQKEAVENPPEIDEENAPTSLDDINRSEISQQKTAVSPDAALVVNRPAQEEPQIEQAGNAAQSETEAPSKPIVAEGSEAAAGEIGTNEGAGGEGVQASANQAAGLASQLFEQASANTVDSPPNMTSLQPTAPVDAAGQALPVNTAADTQMVGLLDQAQSLRDQGQALRQGAAEQRSNAITIRGNILLAKGSMNEVNANLESAQGDLAYRREVLGQANDALAVSEQKAETVAEQAPEHQAKADEGRADSEPMASEVADMSSETAENTPNDEEAAGKAQEQGQKVDQVNSDTQTTDDAFAESQSKAQVLSDEAEAAKATNEQTQEQLTGVDSTLAGTDEKLAEFSVQNTATRAHFDSLEAQPNGLITQADTLDQQGQSLIQASLELETQIHQAQADYETSMASVPASTAPAEAGGSAAVVVQRTPTRPGERVNLHIDEWAQSHLGGWLGYDPINEEERQRQFAESERRRAAQIQAITDRYGANLERASAWDKVLMGASLAGDNLFNSAANASWPRFFGHFVQGLVDPRIGLQGIVSGLNMTLSGVANAANLFTGEDLTWENAIKSTAEIVTGITYLLGGITLVATAIAVILTAIAIIGSLFSFGGVGAALAPFITFFWSTVTTVGGWTILWAKFALLVQFIAGIKDLIDAAAATTATDLQGQSQQMSEDATQMAGAAAIIGLAKLGEIGGRTAIGQRAASGINGFLGGRGIPSPFKAAPPQELPPIEPVAAEPVPAKPVATEPTPIEPIPAEPTPAEPTPVEPTPVEPTPVEPTPAEPTPVEPTPVEPTPVEPTPVEPTPVEPTPVEPTPAEPTPAEPTPAEPAEQQLDDPQQASGASSANSRRVNLKSVRYSQRTVSPKTRDGQTIDEVAQSMSDNGWDNTAKQPDMIDWEDGGYQTLDHRRLVAAERAGLTEVGAEIHAPNEPLPADQLGRFVAKRTFTDPQTGITYNRGQSAQTWGDAALIRSANQGKTFPLRGSSELPSVSGGSDG